MMSWDLCEDITKLFRQRFSLWILMKLKIEQRTHSKFIADQKWFKENKNHRNWKKWIQATTAVGRSDKKEFLILRQSFNSKYKIFYKNSRTESTTQENHEVNLLKSDLWKRFRLKEMDLV